MGSLCAKKHRDPFGLFDTIPALVTTALYRAYALRGKNESVIISATREQGKNE